MSTLTLESSRLMRAREQAIWTVGNALGYCLAESYRTLTSDDAADIERSTAMWKAFILLQEVHRDVCNPKR
jgi:hypothetical protein